MTKLTENYAYVSRQNFGMKIYLFVLLFAKVVKSNFGAPAGPASR